MANVISKGLSQGEYLRLMALEDVNVFEKIIEWEEQDYVNLESLLNQLDIVNDAKESKTTDKGKVLEDIARYVIDKTFFFKVCSNIKTTTNEIDQVVLFTKHGKQALHKYQLSRELIPIPDDYFLAECKNYSKALGVTWIGKFYGLLTSCNCNFGIIFTTLGVTGQENGWKDSYGLMRAYNLIESYRNNKDFSIIEINIEDIRLMLEQRINLFDLIKSKIEGLRVGCTYEQLLDGIQHENVEQIRDVILKEIV